jgi:hypothetical protein
MSVRPVLRSFEYSLAFLRDQVADVSAADLAAQPPGVPNHPLWTIGHLTFACEMLGGVVGLAPWLPEGFADRVGPGSVPVPDPAAYDARDVALARLEDARVRLESAVDRLAERDLDAALPDPSLRDAFPTVRHALVQVLAGHTAFHVGQVAAWRRAMGLGGIGRSYE